MGFRSYIREFFGAVLELVRPSEARCFPPGRWFFRSPPAGDFFEAVLLQQPQATEAVEKGCFSRISEETLGSSWRGFGTCSSFRNTVFPPGRWFFRSCFTAAAAGSRSCRKMLFFQDFRRDIRQFFGVVLELVRPWRFPIRELPFEQKEHQEQEQQQQGGKVAKKSSFSMGFRSYIREFFGAVLELVRPSEARCFPPGRWFFRSCFTAAAAAKKSSFSMGFRSYIWEFFGAVLELVRPSEARCFPPGRWFFRSCFTAAAAGNRSCRKRLFF